MRKIRPLSGGEVKDLPETLDAKFKKPQEELTAKYTQGICNLGGNEDPVVMLSRLKIYDNYRIF